MSENEIDLSLTVDVPISMVLEVIGYVFVSINEKLVASHIKFKVINEFVGEGD